MLKRKQWAVSLLLVFAMLFQMAGTAFASDVAESFTEPIAVEAEADFSELAEAEATEDEADEGDLPETADDAGEGEEPDADSELPDTAETEDGEEPESVVAEQGDESETANSAEEGEELSHERIGPGVWSDEDPYFTDEVPPEIDWGRPFMAPARPFAMFGMPSTFANAVYPTYAEAYDKMMALKSELPEGMTWTNYEPYGSRGLLGENYYFRGGILYGARYGVGCAAFCFLVQDRVYGDLPIRIIEHADLKYEDFHVGDFVRVLTNKGQHFVTITQITSSGVILAEGNNNGAVHWGRSMSKTQLLDATVFLVTRYPVGYTEEIDPDEEAATGKEGALTWTLTAGGHLAITGSGAMPNYLNGDRPSWEGTGTTILSVDIGPGVTSVGDNAFSQLESLVSVSLPDTIERIGNNAFSGSNAIGIAIPSSCKSVGNDAFGYCQTLASIDIADGVETIGERAFRGCTNLQYVDFPSSLRSLGAGAFTSCEELTQVRFMPSRGTLTLGANIFTQCYNLNFVSLPNGITALQPGLFSQCTNVYYLYIPSTVTSLAEAGAESPFMNTTVGTIYFGGTQSQWNSLVNKIPAASYATRMAFSNATVVVEQADPFVPDENSPADMLTCGGGHLGPIEDGVCQSCGEKVSGGTEPVEPVDPTPPEHQHEWAKDWSHDTTHHWHECLVGGYFGCDNDQKDGYAPHTYDGWIVDLEPTTEAKGSRHRVCTVCGHNQTEELDKLTPVNPVDPVDPVDPEHQHDWLKTYSSNSTDHWYDCAKADCPITNNSERDGFGAHVFGDLIIDVPATATVAGSGHKDCVVCAYRATEVIPATGTGTNPGTTPTKPGTTPGSSSTSGPTGGNSTTTPTTNTVTTKNPDGSTTTTVTNKTTGEITATTVRPDGSKTVKTTQKDGSSISVTTQVDGTTVKVSTDANGRVTNEVNLTAAAVNAAEQRGEPVALPLDAMQVVRNMMDAEPITVRSDKGGSVKVEIAVSGLTPGTVVMLVGTDASTNVVKTTVPTANGVTASLPSGATIQIVDNGKSFVDVPTSAWYSDAVAFASARELFAGTSPTDFSPATPMTRAMLMVVLARFDGANTAGGTTWYEKATEWAMSHGISDGTRPSESITREQLVTMLWRYMGSPTTSGSLSGYTDVAEISGYAQDAMLWAVENGLLSGFGDGRLGPQGEATRAQVATILKNLIINLM